MKVLRNAPEYYLLILVLIVGYTPPISISFLSILLVILLALQIIFKHKITGFLISVLFALTNLYLLFALFSEFSEFATFNTQAKKLLFVGLALFILHMFISVVMIFRYTKPENKLPQTS